MDLRVCDHNPCPRGVLYRVLGLAFLSANSAYAPAQVISVQSLNVLDLKCLQVKIIKPEYRDCILELKAKHESLEEIGCLLDGSHVFSLGRCLLGQG